MATREGGLNDVPAGEHGAAKDEKSHVVILVHSSACGLPTSA